MSPSPRPDDVSQITRGTRRIRAIAALVCGVEAVALLGFCGFYLLEIARGEQDDTTRALMSAVLIALFAVALGFLAIQWVRSSPWVRTPTIVWNLLLLPVTWGLVQSGRVPVALAVGGVAIVGLGAAILAGDADGGPDGVGDGGVHGDGGPRA
ncbi:conserved membrane hypothetical protein [Nostocoides japonicum T1-X7]|uniref:Integral membrane protein n=1 Tax=Nostocoides japonicum T1-X7 TaxID=1194083 RepID=A0A077M5F0_9MICO|nr:hypothetical protein [Tetrasphaera japonica]CCH79452.1 conserved membrane hypothetical protein [Tetrasphaera japonica T1-X7]CCH80297.1 conserved membrane hypothetical protein [Tetrasphaera japonica T1-X7]